MTEEDIREAKEREEELKKEARMEMIYQRNLERVEKYIKPWFPNWFTQPLFDATQDLVKDRELQPSTHGTIIVIMQLLLLVLVAYILGLVWHPLALLLYVGLYMQTEGIVFLAFAMYWIMNKIVKIFTMPSERTFNQEMSASYQKSTYTGPCLEAYIAIIVLLSVSYLVHGSQYAPVLQSTWIIVVVIIMAKLVPGVGGNSTIGSVMLFFSVLIAFITVPDIWRLLLQTTKSVLEPPIGPRPSNMAGPTAEYVKTISWQPLRVLSLGFSYDNFWDLLRLCAGFAPQIWLIFDDLIGPGVSIAKATEVKTKNPNLKTHDGWAAIYTGTWWMTVLMQFFMSWYTNNVFNVMMMTITTFVVWFIWDWIGRREWKGRGQVVTMTDVKAGTGMVFGQGPAGLRILILRIASITAWLCVVVRNVNSFTAIGVVAAIVTIADERLTTVMLGVGTLDPVWMYQAWSSKYPVTQSLHKNTVDAYTDRDPG